MTVVMLLAVFLAAELNPFYLKVRTPRGLLPARYVIIAMLMRLLIFGIDTVMDGARASLRHR